MQASPLEIVETHRCSNQNTSSHSLLLFCSGLALLQEEGQPDFVQEIIELYLTTAPSMIVEIQQAVRQGHPDQLRYAAHSLKGSSHRLGAIWVGEISAELEAKGRNGSIEGVESLLADLEREFEHVRQALRDWRVHVA